MKALIAAGAEVDARNDRGETALYECACTDRTREMAVLLEAGADVNTRPKDESTPLMSAAVCGEANVVTALLAAKADPRLADKNGRTAILGIAQFNMHFVRSGRTPEENLARIVKELVAAGGDPNAKQRYDGATPLMEAAEQDNLQVVRALIEAGANVNAKDNYGNTALQEAKDKPEIAAALKAAGAVAKPSAKKK
jgi:ankyrin repeat protein